MALDNNIQHHQMNSPLAGVIWFLVSGFCWVIGYIDFHGVMGIIKEISPIFTIAAGVASIYYSYKKNKKQ